MFWKKLSITKKIFLTISLTSVIIVAMMAGLMGFNVRNGFSNYLLQAETNHFDGLETALAKNYDRTAQSWPELANGEGNWLDFVMQNFGSDVPPRGDPQMRFGGGPNPMPGEGFPPPPPPPGLNAPAHLIDRIGLLDRNGETIAGKSVTGEDYVTSPIYLLGSGSNSEPVGWISLTAPVGAIAPADALFLRDQYQSLIMASFIALVLSLIMAVFLARQFLFPIRELAAGSDRLTSGDFTGSISHQRKDELGKLMDQYNELAKSLEHAQQVERQWITDTSHELQTPLAVLRAEIEALQDGIRKPTGERLNSLHNSVLRLSALVGDINTLARTGEGALSLSLEPNNLSSIIETAVAHAGENFKASAININADIEPDITLNCDQFRMRQVIDNLLENSRRYTNPNGRVHISARQNKETVTLVIEDSAPCPPVKSIDQLFDRFYRVEQSRSRESGGSGLGLSICQSIIRAHGGQIALSPSELGGLQVRITLPNS